MNRSTPLWLQEMEEDRINIPEGYVGCPICGDIHKEGHIHVCDDLEFEDEE